MSQPEHSLKFLLLTAFFCLFGVTAQASWLSDSYSSNGSREAERAQELADVRAKDDKAAIRLLEFREKIEKESYKTTMSLCFAYRKAKGMAMPHRFSNEDQMLAESELAWGKIFYEGTAQPFSAIAGLKSEYISSKEISLFAIDSWFRSLYTIYLLDTMGFLQASAHCLNTLDHNEIMNFASTIMAFDLAGTAGTEFAMGVGVGAIVGKIGKVADVFALKPAWRLASLVGVRKTQVVIAGMIVTYIAADNLFVYLKQIEEGKKAALELLKASDQEQGIKRRFLILNRAYELYKNAADMEAQGKDASEAAQKYKNYVAQQLSFDKRSAYLYDQGELMKMSQSDLDKPQNKFNKTYLALLNLILSTLEI